MEPTHVGIIPDGNRRWARRNGESLHNAYRRGYERILEAVDYLTEKGVRYVSIYTLSYENCLRRPREELRILRALSIMAFERIRRDPRVVGGEARIIVLGNPGLVGDDVREAAFRAMKESRWGTKYVLTVLYCYSGAWESELVMKGYYFPSKTHLPPVDLIIRTGGYRRISGFLPFLTEYSELYVSDVLWPDASPFLFDDALEWYRSVERNFGG